MITIIFWGLVLCLFTFFVAPILSEMAVQTIKKIRSAYDQNKRG